MCKSSIRPEDAGLTLDGVARCSSCKAIKENAAFYPDKSRTSGLSSRCRPCDRARLQALPSRQIERELRKLAEKFPKHRALIVTTAAALAA